MRSSLFLAVILTSLGGCGQRAPDFIRTIGSPSGGSVASFSGYQPRGTIEGYLTVTVTRVGDKNEPQLTFGHMLNVRAGWLDQHHFALVYEVLESRHSQSPIFTTGEADSAVEVSTCNTRYLDCTPLLRRLSAKNSLLIKEFPEGGWSELR
jgi:hypothetical protein